MIKPKEHKCKGTGLAKGYGCGKLTNHRVYGLGKMCCYTNWLLNSENGKIKLEKSRIKAKKIVEKEKRVLTKKEKEELTDWRDKLQTKIQEISRLIDIGLPCLARGHHANQIHGGHVFAKGGNKTIALNTHNIHRQGAHSNHFQNDDGLLREGLKNEYGEDYLNFISELRRCEALHYSNIEYHEFYKKACKIALKLKKEGRNFMLEERICKRNEVNLELGIYDYEYCVFQSF